MVRLPICLTTTIIYTRNLLEFCLAISLLISAWLIGFGADTAPYTTKANHWFKVVWLSVICIACIILLLNVVIQTLPAA